MTENPDRGYIEGKVAQIKAACDLFGGEGVTAIIEQVREDGYHALAAELAAGVVDQWLQNGGVR